MLLEGTLATFPLAELLALIAANSVTGALSIQTAQGLGHIFSRDGRLYHAELASADGFNALCLMFEEDAAQFWFRASRTSPYTTIQRSTLEIAHEAERAAVVWRTLRDVLPSLDYVPQLATPATDKVRVPEAAWPLLSAIDGKRSVADIAMRVGQVPLEVAEAVAALARRGLVTIQPPAAQPLFEQALAEPPVAATQTASQAPHGSLFNRFSA